MKSPPRARSPTLLRILLYSGFGAENRLKEQSSFLTAKFFNPKESPDLFGTGAERAEPSLSSTRKGHLAAPAYQEEPSRLSPKNSQKS